MPSPSEPLKPGERASPCPLSRRAPALAPPSPLRASSVPSESGGSRPSHLRIVAVELSPGALPSVLPASVTLKRIVRCSSNEKADAMKTCSTRTPVRDAHAERMRNAVWGVLSDSSEMVKRARSTPAARRRDAAAAATDTSRTTSPPTAGIPTDLVTSCLPSDAVFDAVAEMLRVDVDDALALVVDVARVEKLAVNDEAADCV